MVNIFSLKATDPKDLKASPDPGDDEESNSYLLRYAEEIASEGGMSPEFSESVEAFRAEFAPFKNLPKVGRARFEAVVTRLQQSESKPARVAGSLLAKEIDMTFGCSHRGPFE